MSVKMTRLSQMNKNVAEIKMVSNSDALAEKDDKKQTTLRRVKKPSTGNQHREITSGVSNLPARANELFQQAKTQLEQSGNIKTQIKEIVIENLGELYQIILTINEERELTQSKLENLELRINNEVGNEIKEEYNKQQQEILKHIEIQTKMAEETKKEIESIKTQVQRMNENNLVKENITYATKTATPRKF